LTFPNDFSGQEVSMPAIAQVHEFTADEFFNSAS